MYVKSTIPTIHTSKYALEMLFYTNQYQPVELLSAFLVATQKAQHNIDNTTAVTLYIDVSVHMDWMGGCIEHTIGLSLANYGLWDPEVQCRIHRGCPIISILSRNNPYPRVDTYFYKISSNIVLPTTPMSS